MISRMIANWREQVWSHAVSLIHAADPAQEARAHVRVEADALKHADAILLRNWRAVLGELL